MTESNFHSDLPLQPAGTRPLPARRLLVVDDDPVVRSSIQKLLEREGYVVAVSANGKEALSLLQNEGFECLLTDIVMPDVDGFELLQSVRQRFPALKVVTMSGGSRGFASNYLRVSRFLGAARQIEKPFTLDQLLAVLAGIDGRPVNG